MRIDEFSRTELRESHATIQELTSQLQVLQERKNYTNDSQECQDVESIAVSRQSSQVLELCQAATKACDQIHGICLGHRETLLAIDVQFSIITDT